ncbi:MAG: dihydrodipicolinate synthase family protein [Ruthenibacterium sp.]
MTKQEQAMINLHAGTVIPAIPLCLNENRQYDEKGQRLLLRYYLNAGSGGIAAAVHTTQFEIRLPQYNLYEPVLKTVADEIDRYEAKTGKTIVRVAGVCGEIAQAVKEAALCKKLGYTAVLLSPGGVGHLTEAEMLTRTAAVADIMPVIGFYLQPAAGGRIFTFDYWKKLAAIENVVAIKCASFNRYTTIDVVRAVAECPRGHEITLYTGNDDNIVVDLLTEYKFEINGKSVTRRFEGGLLGHWSVWTKSAVELFERLKIAAKEPMISQELLTLAAEVTDTNAVLFDACNNFRGCIAGLHEVLRRQGLMKGIWCLNPEETMSVGQAQEIDRIYRMYPHLNDDAFIQKNIENWKKDL